LKDDSKGQLLKIECHSLYEIRIKKHLSTRVQKEFDLSYQDLELKFGINFNLANQSEKLMISNLFLQLCYLKMPTMDINKGDAEDSDNEEEVLIDHLIIDTAAYKRILIDV
jgi:hypothetical protein